MKLRLKGNSVRLRLTRSEVERLGAAGIVEEAVDFGHGATSFEYAAEAVEGLDTLDARFEDRRLSILIPAEIAVAWANSEEVGIEAVRYGLRIVIEKDFACMAARPGEDETDMFANPAAVRR